jgi:hypothetical protein
MLSMALHICFQNSAGKCRYGILPSNYTTADFVNLHRDRIGSGYNYRFTTAGGQLDLSDERVFDTQKQMIFDNCRIYVIERLRGGCFLPDTLVMRADKSEAPINTIQPGDEL